MIGKISQPSLSTQAESRYYRTAIGFSVQKGTVAKKGSIKLPSGAATPDIFVQVPQRSRYNAAHLVVDPGQYLLFIYFYNKLYCMVEASTIYKMFDFSKASKGEWFFVILIILFYFFD